MNITQQKNLIAITKRALALLDPEWIVTTELKGELLKAMRAVDVDAVKPAKKATSRKMKKAELYTYRPIVSDVKHVEPKGKMTRRESLKNGKSVDDAWWVMAKDEVTTCQCAPCQIRAGFWTRGMKDTSNIANDAKNKLASAESVRANLSKCACGHFAEDHQADELENLLECSGAGCKCTQFHYDNDQKQAA